MSQKVYDRDTKMMKKNAQIDFARPVSSMNGTDRCGGQI